MDILKAGYPAYDITYISSKIIYSPRTGVQMSTVRTADGYKAGYPILEKDRISGEYISVQFVYGSEAGALVSKVRTADGSSINVYYNGGCAFNIRWQVLFFFY